METSGTGPDRELTEDTDIQPPEDGAGPLNHRVYSVQIHAPKHQAAALVELFRRDPNAVGPSQLATFVPDPAPDGLQVGDDIEVKIPGPWDGPIRVVAVTPDRIRFETRTGHMEAGWIEFRAKDHGEITEFVIESLARSGDPIFDSLYHRLHIAKYLQSEMWVQVLEGLLAASGGTRHGRIQIQTTIYNGADS